MTGFYTGALNSPYMDWLSEYNTVGLNGQDGQPGSNQTIGRGGLGSVVTLVPSITGTTISDTQIQSEISAQINAGHLPAGSWVHERLLKMPDARELDNLPIATRVPPKAEPLEGYTFQGFRNADGSVGTRNLLAITTTVPPALMSKSSRGMSAERSCDG